MSMIKSDAKHHYKILQDNIMSMIKSDAKHHHKILWDNIMNMIKSDAKHHQKILQDNIMSMIKSDAKHYCKILQDNITNIIKLTIHCLMCYDDIKCISAMIYNKICSVLKIFLKSVFCDVVTYTEYVKCKTVTSFDVIYTLKRQEHKLSSTLLRDKNVSCSVFSSILFHMSNIFQILSTVLMIDLFLHNLFSSAIISSWSFVYLHFTISRDSSWWVRVMI